MDCFSTGFLSDSSPRVSLMGLGGAPVTSQDWSSGCTTPSLSTTWLSSMRALKSLSTPLLLRPLLYLTFLQLKWLGGGGYSTLSHGPSTPTRPTLSLSSSEKGVFSSTSLRPLGRSPYILGVSSSCFPQLVSLRLWLGGVARGCG